jgi:C1A family cysteine protease
MERKYLLQINKIDSRDLLYTPPTIKTILSIVDLRTTGLMPDVLNQGNLGSCAANATSNALKYLLNKQKLPVFQPSRLYIYYNTRVKIDFLAPSNDSGCTIRNVCKSINKYYACDEEFCPYIINNFKIAPTLLAYQNANLHKRIKYSYVKQDLNNIKKTLANEYPIIIGVIVYDSFELESTLSSGHIPMPDTQNEQLLGGHALLLCGYNDKTQRFIVQNSWGTGIGLDGTGYFDIPYAYLTNPNLASDFWVFEFYN